MYILLTLPCDQDHTSNPAVAYAYAAVLDADQLTIEDRLILHALGAAWIQNGGNGKCLKREPIQ
jgi:hypothetical protein